MPVTDGHLKVLGLLGGEEDAEDEDEEEPVVEEEEEVDEVFIVGDELCARPGQVGTAGKDSEDEEVGMSCGRSAGRVGFGCSRLCMGGKG